MFGLGFTEILIVLVVAIIFLGPDKMPKAIIDLVKFFKVVKKSINDAKESFDREIKIDEIKKEALEYKRKIEGETENIIKDMKFGDLKDLGNMSSNKDEEKTESAPIDSTATLDSDDLVHFSSLEKLNNADFMDSAEKRGEKDSPKSPKKSTSKIEKS